MFSGFRIYFSRVVLILIDRSSNPVAFLLVLDVCGVMCGVPYVLSLLFCSSFCCLWGDLNLLGFDRAMFVDKTNKVFASFGGSVWARNL
jgi:hypothetical protein